MIRDGSDVGSHALTVSGVGTRVRMKIDIAIRIKFLGITAYRYDHTNTEVWENGVLVQLDAKTNDDGDEEFVRVRRVGDALRVEGTAFTGAAPADAVPTSYWYYDAAVGTRNWISTQSGKLLSMSFAKTPWSNGGQQVSTDGGFKTTLFYDAEREWVGCRFDAGGEDIDYKLEQAGPSFRPLIKA